MKTINYILLSIISALFLISSVQSLSNRVEPNDPRVLFGNSEGHLLSNFPSVQDNNGNFEFIETNRKRLKRLSKSSKKVKKSKALPYGWGKGIKHDVRSCNEGPGHALDNFASSTCSPVVIVPGIMGTRISAKYKCSEVQDTDLWNTCPRVKYECSQQGAESYFEEIWVNLYYEYNVKFFSTAKPQPSGIFYHASQAKGCFGMVLQVDLSPLETLSEKERKKPIRFPDNKGVKVNYLSSNPKEYKQFCGFDRTDVLNADPIIGEPNINNVMSAAGQDSLDGYVHMKNFLIEKGGYTVGLNLFSMPYDWRQRPGDNDLPRLLLKTLKWSHYLNNKKTVIISHSFGGLNTLYSLNQVPDIQKYVERWIPIAPPLSGAFQPMMMASGYFNSLYPVMMDIGIKMDNMRQLQGACPGGLSLSLKVDTFGQGKEKWAQEFDKLMHNRENKLIFPLEQTHNFYNYFKNPFASTEDGSKQYVASSWASFKEFMTNNVMIPPKYLKKDAAGKDQRNYFRKIIFPRLLQHLRADDVGKLNNPQVPVTLIYSSNLNTEQNLVLHPDSPDNQFFTNNQNVEDEVFGKTKVIDGEKVTSQYVETIETTDETGKIHKQKKVHKKIGTILEGEEKPGNFDYLVKGKGDGSVNAESAALAALKWAYEYDNKESHQNYHPVDLVHVCAEKSINPLYEQGTIDGKKKDVPIHHLGVEEQNNYYTSKCITHTAHQSMVHDPYVLFYVGRVVTKSGKTSLPRALNENEVETIQDMCPNIYDEESDDPEEMLMRIKEETKKRLKTQKEKELEEEEHYNIDDIPYVGKMRKMKKNRNQRKKKNHNHKKHKRQ